mmetsp:Transcript_20209/g.37670  ORF Transcript_20209/g.37670 Transcript_20209/m.37670 type:complete len:332 (-) Transcript_20209:167-1162(-)
MRKLSILEVNYCNSAIMEFSSEAPHKRVNYDNASPLPIDNSHNQENPRSPESERALDEKVVVFIKLKVGKKKIGRVCFELFEDVPLAAENFRALCTGEKGFGKYGKPLHYEGSVFYRKTGDFCIEGGDFISNSGKSGESIYGDNFTDFSITRSHSVSGLLSLVGLGSKTFNSRFLITLAPSPFLDKYCLVIGKLMPDSYDKLIVHLVQALTFPDGRLINKINIYKCGQLCGSTIKPVEPQPLPPISSKPPSIFKQLYCERCLTIMKTKKSRKVSDGNLFLALGTGALIYNAHPCYLLLSSLLSLGFSKLWATEYRCSKCKQLLHVEKSCAC